MMRVPRLIAVTVSAVCCWSGSRLQAEPEVVLTQPANGDQAVSPNLAEISVTFDEDMDTAGYSLTGGGSSFPKLLGKPVWRTARVFALAVRLEPDHAYQMGINSQSHQNFRSAQGVPVVPVSLAFKTAPVQTTQVSPQAMAVDPVRMLREAIDRSYSYREVRKIDWAAAWAKYQPRLAAAKSPRDFAETAGEMLAATGDPHIWLMEGGQLIPAFRRDVSAQFNFNRELLPKLVKGWKQWHPAVASGLAAPGVGYLAIGSWERKLAPQSLEAAFAALAELQRLPALVIDVRANSGGDETLARDLAGCFVREKTVYAKHVVIDPASPTGFSPPVERALQPAASRPAYAGRVAVLMGPNNMSSAEAFLLMMRQAPRATLVGARSYGASGNPQPHELGNGVTVYLPSWKALLPDGTPFETIGLAPAVEVKTTRQDFKRRDPVLDKAVELLGNEVRLNSGVHGAL